MRHNVSEPLRKLASSMPMFARFHLDKDASSYLLEARRSQRRSDSLPVDLLTSFEDEQAGSPLAGIAWEPGHPHDFQFAASDAACWSARASMLMPLIVAGVATRKERRT